MSEMMSVNYEKVLKSPEFSSVTKMAIMKLQKQQYVTFAEFVQGLSDVDLDQLTMMFDMMKSFRS